ncbi:MAG: TIGR01777 family oxidoreductase [Motiliproteus sp.]
MKLLITGASGFIGSALTRQLLAEQHQIIGLSRKAVKLQKRYGDQKQFRAISNLTEIDDDEVIDAVVNLAGEPILDKRWTDNRKQLLRNSRLQTTEALIDLIERLVQKPEVLISGSAIGFYGSQPGDRVVDELTEGRPGFTHKLCSDWEDKALQAVESQVRVCLLRTGVVLGDGGALARMLTPFKLGLGGVIGSGQQWFSWIYLDDMVAAIVFLLEHQVLSGAFNATAPEPVTNAVFTKALGRALKRPTLLPMPAMALQLMLGEGAELLCEGQRVMPVRLREAGFEFSCRNIDQALQHLSG